MRSTVFSILLPGWMLAVTLTLVLVPSTFFCSARTTQLGPLTPFQFFGLRSIPPPISNIGPIPQPVSDSEFASKSGNSRKMSGFGFGGGEFFGGGKKGKKGKKGGFLGGEDSGGGFLGGLKGQGGLGMDPATANMGWKEIKENYKASFYLNPGWFPSVLPAVPPLSDFQKHQSSNYYPNPQYGLMLQQNVPPPRPPHPNKNISALFSNWGYVGPYVEDEPLVIEYDGDTEEVVEPGHENDEEGQEEDKKTGKLRHLYEKVKSKFNDMSELYHLVFK